MVSGDNGSARGIIWQNCVAVDGVKAKMSRGSIGHALAGAALLLAGLAMGGCSTSIGDIPLGTTSSTEARPKDGSGYMPVNDVPPNREEAAMDPAERAKLQKELVAARDRQASAVNAKDQAPAKDQSQSSK